MRILTKSDFKNFNAFKSPNLSRSFTSFNTKRRSMVIVKLFSSFVSVCLFVGLFVVLFVHLSVTRQWAWLTINKQTLCLSTNDTKGIHVHVAGVCLLPSADEALEVWNFVS